VLYLHIGTNKAGLTTIQRFIASDAAVNAHFLSDQPDRLPWPPVRPPD
jgi:hypothetical protein